MARTTKQFFSSLVCALLVFWIALSIVGAFLGAQKAHLFFNSPPLLLFWAILLTAFLAGFFVWRQLWRQPTMVLCHGGCVLVLLGGFAGSPVSFWVRKQMGLAHKTFKSYLELNIHQASHIAYADRTGEPVFLPFTVRMTDARALYYDTPTIGIFSADGALVARLPIEIGKSAQLDADCRVEIARRFDNLKMTFDPQTQQMRGQEAELTASNPGYEIVYWFADGQQIRQYVFESRRSHSAGDAPFQAVFIPPQLPKRYESDLIIERDGQIVAQKTIRVNDPLHYGGYHFYQNTYGRNEQGNFSGIMIVADDGVAVVFAGYALLTVGVCGRFWLKPLWQHWRHRGNQNAS